jgi:hypothetical protein
MGELAWGFSCLVFPWCYGLSVVGRSLKWSHQKASLWAIIGPFGPQGRLQLRSVVAHYQIIQRWSDMFLFSPHGSWVTPQQQLWLVNSSHNKVRQFSVLSHPQFQEKSSEIHHVPALGGWLLWLPLLSEFGSLPLSPQRSGQHSTPPLLTAVNYVHCLWHSVFFRGSECNMAINYAGLCSQEDRLCLVLTSWDCRFTLMEWGAGWQGEMVGRFSQGRCMLGLCLSWSHTRSRLAGCIQTVLRLWVHYVTESSSVWFTVFYFLQGKKTMGGGRNSQRLFPRQMCPMGYTFPCWDFPVTAIKNCFNGQSLNLMCTLCVGANLLGYKESELPKM